MPSNILVIEADAPTRALLGEVLELLGHRTWLAEDGTMGAELFAVAPIDLVITDVFLPGDDGTETILRLKQAASAPKVIAISGGGTLCGMQVLRLARLFGADAALSKPLNLPVLAETVRGLLYARAAEFGASLAQAA